MPQRWMPGPAVCHWLAEKYEYDPSTGFITRADDGRRADMRIATNGYPMVRLTNAELGVRGYVSAHRLAWFLINGVFPDAEVDHINRCKTDNSCANLRLASRVQNHGNGPKKVSRTGTPFSSKYRGVHWSKKDSRWMAQINSGHGTKHIGSFRNEDDAARAYNKAAREVFGEYANLNQVDEKRSA